MKNVYRARILAKKRRFQRPAPSHKKMREQILELKGLKPFSIGNRKYKGQRKIIDFEHGVVLQPGIPFIRLTAQELTT